LGGVGEVQVKIFGFWPNTDANTTYIVDGVLRVVAAEVENALPQDLVGWMPRKHSHRVMKIEMWRIELGVN
jgi:hypothetical protein